MKSTTHISLQIQINIGKENRYSRTIDDIREYKMNKKKNKYKITVDNV